MVELDYILYQLAGLEIYSYKGKYIYEKKRCQRKKKVVPIKNEKVIGRESLRDIWLILTSHTYFPLAIDGGY